MMDFRQKIQCIQIGTYVMGIIGSVMIIIIMLRPTFRSMPRSLVCIALAVVDLLFLIKVLVVATYSIVNDIQLTQSSQMVCKFNGFLIYYFTHLDASFITILTLERLLAVARPYHVNQIITRFKITIIIGILVVIFLAWDGELIFRTDLKITRNPKTNKTTSFCGATHTYGQPSEIFMVKDTISMLLRSFIPIGIIVLANLVIIIKLFRQKQERSRMTTAPSQDHTSKVTWMIVLASIAFVITVTPINVYKYLYLNDKIKKSPEILSIFGLLYRINPVVNFYIYFIAGGLFKTEVKHFLASLSGRKCCK